MGYLGFLFMSSLKFEDKEAFWRQNCMKRKTIISLFPVISGMQSLIISGILHVHSMYIFSSLRPRSQWNDFWVKFYVFEDLKSFNPWEWFFLGNF